MNSINSYILTCKQLSKSFKRNNHEIQVLKNIDLTIKTGEIIIIYGKSGVGKSVLVSLLAGLLSPDSGYIMFKGSHINKLSKQALANFRRNDLGIVFQNHNLLSSWTALENVMIGSFNHNQKSSATRAQAMNLLTRLGIESRMDHFPHEMSMGEQQRVAIARLLMTSPELILADEPTSDVDPETAKEILKHLISIVKENESGLIVTTHGHFPLNIADHVFELSEGMLIEK